MTNKGKPRRTSGTRFRPEMDSEDPVGHVFVDIETEGQADLLGDPLAPHVRLRLSFQQPRESALLLVLLAWPSDPIG